MKPWLCAAGVQLRDQIDTWYPDRRSTSDGWIGDARHSANKSDHNPDERSGFVVRAVDVDSRLDSSEGISIYLADQIRKCAKTDKRISYVIHNGFMPSGILQFFGSMTQTEAKSLVEGIESKFTGMGNNHKRRCVAGERHEFIGRLRIRRHRQHDGRIRRHHRQWQGNDRHQPDGRKADRSVGGGVGLERMAGRIRWHNGSGNHYERGHQERLVQMRRDHADQQHK